MRRQYSIWSVAFLSLMHLSAAAQYREGEIYVRFKTEQSVSKAAVTSKENLLSYSTALQGMLARYELMQLRCGFYFSKTERFKRTYRLKFRRNDKVDELLKELNALPDVEFAEKIPLDKLHWLPNDLGTNTTGGQYALHLVEAERAWDIHRGSTSVRVAVVDNGVELNHVDLTGKLSSGYDVAEDDSDPDVPSSLFDHGTHVAGIIGANTNNNIGIASIGNRVRVMPIKATGDDDDPDEITDGYEGILWAAEHGADIINCSWGSYDYSVFNQEVINEAFNTYLALVVASAGNDNTSLAEYPAAYNNCLAVASSTINDVKSSFSNYGFWVDIVAPGSSIRSTDPYSTYGSKNGTSMAAPLVAGVCGLIKSCSNSYTPSSIATIVKSTANPIIYANDPSYNGLLGTGRLDAYAALVDALVCRNNATITGDPFTTPLYESSTYILTSGNCIIPPNEQVVLDAASYIELRPGFHAQSGTVFRADIEGCGDGPPDGAINPVTEAIVSVIKRLKISIKQ